MRTKWLIAATATGGLLWSLSVTPSWSGVLISELLHKAFVIVAPISIMIVLLSIALRTTGRWVLGASDLHNPGKVVIEWRDPQAYVGIVAWFLLGAVGVGSVGYWMTWEQTVNQRTYQTYQRVFETVGGGEIDVESTIEAATLRSNYLELQAQERENALQVVWEARVRGNIGVVQAVGDQNTTIVDSSQFLGGVRGVLVFEDAQKIRFCALNEQVGSLNGILTSAVAQQIHAAVGRPVRISSADAYGACSQDGATLYIPFTEYEGWWWPVEVPTGMAIIQPNGLIRIVNYDQALRERKGPWFPQDLLATLGNADTGWLTFQELTAIGVAPQLDAVLQQWIPQNNVGELVSTSVKRSSDGRPTQTDVLRQGQIVTTSTP